MALPSYATLPQRVWHYGLRAFCGLVFLFLVAPILVVLPLSFNAEPYFSYPMPGYSLRWYDILFNDPVWTLAARNSVIVAVATTALSMLLGTLAALGLSRPGFPLRQLVMGIILSPVIVPIVITSIGVYFFYAKLNLVNTLAGLILAHTVLAVPFVVIMVTTTLSGFDVNQARAGASLGANPVQVFFRITMPLIMPGIFSGAVLAFVTSFDEVVVALFLAGLEQRTIPREMFKNVREQTEPTILAVSCILVAVSVVLLVLMEWLRRRNLQLRGISP